jgi:L-rhamnose isomerase/sugar isomerase
VERRLDRSSNACVLVSDGSTMASQSERFAILADDLARRGVDVQAVKKSLLAQSIETPSWGYSDSGTRFAVFRQPGAARNLRERLADAAQVQRFTGVCPSVAVHIPWDRVDDYRAVCEEAAAEGVRIGAVNPNLFQDQAYKFGSFANPDPAVRRRAIEHVEECIEVMRITGSRILSLWLADGTNYPGQDSVGRRKRAIEESLAEVYAKLPSEASLLLEYKPFEPAFYHTDVADWGMALVLCRKLGPRARVLVDLGHHYHGQNIEQIVAWLLDEGMLGGFHFNNRKYADDDLTTGSVNPYEVFLIFRELAAGGGLESAFMIDQSHNEKPKIEAMIQTALFLQGSLARALCVDEKRLEEARAAGDVVAAELCFQQAFQTDVEPLLIAVREELGRPADPLEAYRRSGYQAKIEAQRLAPLPDAAGWA